MQEKSLDQDAARRRLILDAARDCFLKFGYAKTSFEDIAKGRHVSTADLPEIQEQGGDSLPPFWRLT
jgi:AcrR family transcriptional regulator